MKKCNPSKYAVVAANGAITYGFRCAKHNVPSLRYSTRELRDERLEQHQKAAKKASKK